MRTRRKRWRISVRTPYWSETTLFAEPAYYEDEVAKLKEKRVPVHCYYIQGKFKYETKKCFEWIAQETGGQCEWLILESRSQATEKLTNIVCEHVLYAISS